MAELMELGAILGPVLLSQAVLYYRLGKVETKVDLALNGYRNAGKNQ